MRRRLLRVLMAGVWGIMSLSAYSESVSPTSQGWSADWLVGVSLQLVSESRVQSLHFVDKQSVLLTVGEKGGPLAGLVASWRIAGSTLLVDDSIAISDALEFVSRDNNRVVVRTRGELATYEIIR